MRGPATLLIGLILLACAVSPVHAQEDERPRLDLAIGGGATWSSDWSDLVVLGTVGGLVERVLLRDLAVDPGALGDLTVTYWEGRYGFRVHGGYSASCLSVGPGCTRVLPFDLRDRLGLVVGDVDVNTWFADIGGSVLLVEPKQDQGARPYVTAGIGAVVYDLEGSARNLLPTFVSIGGAPGRLALDTLTNVVVVVDDNPFLVAVDEPGLETQFAGFLGIGMDVRLPLREGAFGLRVELTDHIVHSPLDVTLAGFTDGDDDSLIDLDGDGAQEIELDFGLVHNLRFVAGLVLEFPIFREDNRR